MKLRLSETKLAAGVSAPRAVWRWLSHFVDDPPGESWMYRDGHPNRLARTLNRGWAIAGAAGLWPSRLVTLEVRGRRTGRLLSFSAAVLAGGPSGAR